MKIKLVRKVCTLLLIICLRFPLLGQSVQAHGDTIEPTYTTDATGTYPAAAWKPTGQENVINHQGGSVNGWDAAPSDTTNSYIKYGDLADPDLAIRKFARESTIPGTFDVFMNVRGNSVKQAKMLDVVFVVDTSGSMGDNSRLYYAKNGIKDFIDKITESDLANNVRAGLVSYSGEVGTQTKLAKVSENGKKLKTQVSALKADGGTFTQAGLHRAAEMLQDSSSDEKMIILLTDGEPTYSYHVTGAVKETGVVYGTTFDYWRSEGAGSSTEVKDKYWVDQRYYISDTWPATLGEARNIKNSSDISIHALGISIETQYEKKMELLASPGNYKATKSAEGDQKLFERSNRWYHQ